MALASLPPHEFLVRTDSQSDNMDDSQLHKRLRLTHDIESHPSTIQIEQEKRGSILRVSMVNFMCHTNLTIRLGSRINLITGRNGSGKSTILTALSMCLGGRASNTNRAKRLNALIKEGEERGIVAVELSNEGKYAYEPDKYGSSIIIERSLSKKSTASNYRIKDHNGKIVSSKREELDKILDSFEIFIDNPFTILTQDMARSFLASSSPEAKYMHFFKGMQFDKIAAYQEATKEKLRLTESELQNQKNTVKKIRAVWKQKAEEHKKFEKYEHAMVRIVEFRGILMWERVRENDRNIEKVGNDIEKYQEKMKSLENDQSSFKTMTDKFNGQIETIENDINELQQTYMEAEGRVSKKKAELTSFISTIKDLRRDLPEIETNVSKSNELIKAAEKRIKSLTTRAMDDYDEEKKEKRRNLEKITEELNITKKRLDDLLQEETTLTEKIEEIETEKERNLNRINSQITALERSKQSTRASINDLSQGIKSPYDGYAVDMKSILRTIDNSHFDRKPIGPIGSFMKLKDSKWSPILEKIYGANLGGFIAFSEKDRSLLSTILKRYTSRNNSNIPVFLRSGELFSYEQNQPDRRYTNVMDVIEFTDEHVKHLMIDVHHVEGTILFESREQAEAAMRTQPAKVQACYALDKYSANNGFRIGGRTKGAASVAPIDGYNGTARIQMEKSQELHALEAAYQDKVKQLTYLAKEKEKYVGTSNELHQKSVSVKRETRILRDKRTQLSRDEAELKDSLERDERAEDVAAIAAAEAEKRAYEEAKARYDDQLVDLAAQIGAKNKEKAVLQEEYQELKTEADKAAKAKDRKQAEKKAIQNEIQRVTTDRKSFDENIARYKNRIAELTTQKSKCEEEKEINRQKANASTGSEEPIQMPKGQTPESIADKIKELTSLVEQAQMRNGKTLEQVLTEMTESQNKYQEAKEKYETLIRDFKILDEAEKERIEKYEYFREQTCSHLCRLFRENLLERGFDGELIIDRAAEKLSMSIAPMGLEKRDVTTLSGGEKSYSQIALLVAIWEQMNSRLVALDEFDVFMDKVNRRISLSMVMESLNKRKNVQSIFITPQEMELGAISSADDVKIHKMADPRG